jgi:hypothetical protein
LFLAQELLIILAQKTKKQVESGKILSNPNLAAPEAVGYLPSKEFRPAASFYLFNLP